jgi:hypothetical protein
MPPRSRVADILLKAKVVDDLQMRSAMAQHDQWGGRLGKIVADMGLADEDQIADAIASAARLPRVQLGHLPKDPGALAKLDVTFCEQKAVFPVQLKDNGKTLVVAFADPTDLDLNDACASRARARISPAVATETEIMHAISRLYRGVEPRGAPATPRARQAVQASSSSSDAGEEEFKITDMSGKTMMTASPYVGDPDAAAVTDPTLSGPRDVPAPPAPAGAGASAGDILDEILAGVPQAVTDGLTSEEWQRLEKVRGNQDKSAKILQAVMDLLKEKGYTTQKELAARLKL